MWVARNWIRWIFATCGVRVEVGSREGLADLFTIANGACDVLRGQVVYRDHAPVGTPMGAPLRRRG